MKKLMLYFLIILFAVWIGLKIQADPGYVLMVYHGYGIETTFWMAILVLITIFLLFYFLLRLLHGSRILPKRLQFWWHNYKERQAINNTNRALLKFAEEDWHKAEKFFIRSARFAPNPFLNYLKAAKCAQKQQAYNRRDNFLHRTGRELEKSELAIGIIRAKMQIESKQWEQAKILLQHLRSLRSSQPTVLNLLYRVYLELEDWQELRDLLPALRKKSAEYTTALEERVYLELLKIKIAKKEPFDAIEKFWLKMPQYLHNNVELASCYVNYLQANDYVREAERILRAALKKSWHPKLLDLYAAIESKEPLRQLKHTEHWLKAHAEDPSLYLCLGRLCRRQQLWGKAKSYLEKSIALTPSVAAYLELGEIASGQGEVRAALDYFRSGLKMNSEKKP